LRDHLVQLEHRRIAQLFAQPTVQKSRWTVLGLDQQSLTVGKKLCPMAKAGLPEVV